MKLNSKYIIRQIAGETVILPSENDGFNGIMVVSEVGSRILELLQAGCATEEALCEALLEEYDVPAEVLKEDIRAFLKDLGESGILI